MLKNAPTLAIVAVHTEENEPLKFWGALCNLIQLLPYFCLVLEQRSGKLFGGISGLGASNWEASHQVENPFAAYVVALRAETLEYAEVRIAGDTRAGLP